MRGELARILAPALPVGAQGQSRSESRLSSCVRSRSRFPAQSALVPTKLTHRIGRDGTRRSREHGAAAGRRVRFGWHVSAGTCTMRGE